MMGWNLPPGISESDLPGNRPEDAAFEFYVEAFSGGTMARDCADVMLERSGAATSEELVMLVANQRSNPLVLALQTALTEAFGNLDAADLVDLAVRLELAPPFDMWYEENRR